MELFRLSKYQKGRRILCIIRSTSNRKTLPPVLQSANYEVTLALTAEEAVAFCIGNLVAAVVLDSEFHSEAGWSVAQTIKGLHPQLPILLFLDDHKAAEIPQSVDAIANAATMVDELRRLLEKPFIARTAFPC